jgi:hypothetical protein
MLASFFSGLLCGAGVPGDLVSGVTFGNPPIRAPVAPIAPSLPGPEPEPPIDYMRTGYIWTPGTPVPPGGPPGPPVVVPQHPHIGTGYSYVPVGPVDEMQSPGLGAPVRGVF